MKAGIYLRCATSEDEEATLDTQEARCRAAAALAGCEVDPEFIWKERWSGIDLERPKLGEVRQAARAGRISALFVCRPDRLSRDPVQLVTLMEELRAYGVKIHFAAGSTYSGLEAFTAGILEFASQMERAELTERSMQARIRLARSGSLPVGANAGLFGYDYDKVRKMRIVNEEEAEAIRMMFQWASEGVTTYRIAKRLNEMDLRTKRGSYWSRLAVLRILTNCAFTGVQHYGKYRYRRTGDGKRVVSPRPASEVIRVVGFSPPLISQELFGKVQERLEARRSRGAKSGG